MTKKYFTAPLPGTPFVFGLAVRWVAESNRGLPIAKYDSRRLGSVRRKWQRGLSTRSGIK